MIVIYYYNIKHVLDSYLNSNTQTQIVYLLYTLDMVYKKGGRFKIHHIHKKDMQVLILGNRQFLISLGYRLIKMSVPLENAGWFLETQVPKWDVPVRKSITYSKYRW